MKNVQLDNVITCPVCGGSGCILVDPTRIYNNCVPIIQTQYVVVCNHCNGTGNNNSSITTEGEINER